VTLRHYAAGVTSAPRPRRARSSDDKAARRSDILAAAARCLDTCELDAFTMDAVAADLGLAKGTLYRYVPTREALLLALATAEYEHWFDAVEAALPTSDDVARTLVDSVLASPRFTRLASVLGSVLERNIPFDTAHEFKRFVLDRSARLAELLAASAGITLGAAVRVLVQLQALTNGLYHQTHPSPVVAEVLLDPMFDAFRIDFATELLAGARALLAAAQPA
jgi:AcrR family transcriptional regulator